MRGILDKVRGWLGRGKKEKKPETRFYQTPRAYKPTARRTKYKGNSGHSPGKNPIIPVTAMKKVDQTECEHKRFRTVTKVDGNRKTIRCRACGLKKLAEAARLT